MAELLLPGDTVHMHRAQTSLVVEDKLGEGGQAAVYRARMNDARFAVKWYRDGSHDGLRRNLEALVERGRPAHRAFVWPIDMVTAERRGGFGYVMPLMDQRFVSFARMLGAPEPPPFRTLIRVGIELVDAFAVLHASGLCYRDINFGNLWVDPDAAEVAIIDNDNVGPDGGPAFVKGTLRFMAPEVLRDEALPGTATDLHSLATFLFYLFMFGHPLEGRAVEAAGAWGAGTYRSEEDILLEHFGTSPLFVFDPRDAANRPVDGEPASSWWPIYPVFLRREFTQTFTRGLHDGSLSGRVTEGVWRRTLLRLADCVWACGACGAAVFHDPEDPGHRCWGCGGIPTPPSVALVHGHEVVLADGAVLTNRHLKRRGEPEAPVARVELDESFPGRVLLRNLTDTAWTVEPDGEGAKQVKPRQRMLVRPMAVDFGGTTATIAVAHSGKGKQSHG